MATSSFDQEFILSEPEAIAELDKALDNPTPVVFTKRDIEEEKRK